MLIERMMISYRRQHRNEKLAAICVGSSIGHRYCVRSIVTQRWHEFIFEVTAPYWFAASAGASWIARLYHESFDHTMEDVIIVIAIFAVHAEILHRLRTLGGKQFQMNVPTRCMQRCRVVQFLDAYLQATGKWVKDIGTFWMRFTLAFWYGDNVLFRWLLIEHITIDVLQIGWQSSGVQVKSLLSVWDENAKGK